MSTSTLSPVKEETLIQQLNDEKTDLMIPSITYIAVLMVSGLIGNSMVVYYYTFKTKVTTNTIFITCLALYDLITCAICMPTEIVDLVFFYTFDNSTACKILRFLAYLAAWSSVFTLIAICVDRYKHIYHRTRRQIRIGDVKKINFVVFVMALILSWPTILIYDSIHVPIQNDVGLNLSGYNCAITKDSAYLGYISAFNIVNIVMFAICFVVLIVLYSIMGHTIYKHGKHVARLRSKLKADGRSTNSDTTSSTTANAKLKIPSCSNCSSLENHVNKCTTPNTCKPTIPSKHIASTEQDTKTGLDNASVRITMVMIAVTALFIVSFLPHLSMTAWLTAEGKQEAQVLSGAGLVAYEIVARSFLLNSSLNPWIYGVFNSSFRNFYFGKLRCGNVNPNY